MKNVGAISLGEVDRLVSSLSPFLQKRWDVAKKLVLDETLYRSVALPPSSILPPARLASPHDIEEMLRVGKVQKVPPGEDCLGFIRVFWVPEVQKKRRRPIGWPKAFNDFYSKTFLQRSLLPSRQDVRSASLRGNFAISLDLAAAYDQIPLPDCIQKYLCFSYEGSVYRAARLPMGIRPAVEVADTISRILAGEGAWEVYIDNFRFVGKSVDEVVEAARTLCHRCCVVGATLNEVDVRDPLLETKLRGLVVSEGDFLGEHFVYSPSPSVSTTTSIEGWTCRQVAAHVALLLYASNTLAIPLSSYFNFFRWFRGLCSWLSEDESRWSLLPPFSWGSLAEKEMCEWTARVEKNEPRSLTKDERPKSFLFTDASFWGWGAIHVDADGSVSHFSEPWGLF